MKVLLEFTKNKTLFDMTIVCFSSVKLKGVFKHQNALCYTQLYSVVTHIP